MLPAVEAWGPNDWAAREFLESETIRMVTVFRKRQQFTLAVLTKTPATMHSKCGHPKRDEAG